MRRAGRCVMRGQGATLGKRARQGLREKQAYFANGELEQPPFAPEDAAETADASFTPGMGQFQRGRGECGPNQQRGANRRRRDGSCRTDQ